MKKNIQRLTRDTPLTALIIFSKVGTQLKLF